MGTGKEEGWKNEPLVQEFRNNRWSHHTMPDVEYKGSN